MKSFFPILFLAVTGSISATERPLVFFDFDGVVSEGRNAISSDSRLAGRSGGRDRSELLAAARSGSPDGPVKFGFDAGGQEVSSVQFIISSNQSIIDSVDLSRCGAYLPDTHVGGCKIKGDNILFYAFSPVNAKLETGFLGELIFDRPVDTATLQISEEIMGDLNGSELKD